MYIIFFIVKNDWRHEIIYRYDSIIIRRKPASFNSGQEGMNILFSQKKIVDKLHLSEFDQDKEHVSSCERLCNIFNNHRNEGFARVFHTELYLHGERSVQSQPRGKRNILISVAAAFPSEAAAVRAALRCEANKGLSVSQQNLYHYRKTALCRRNKVCQ